MNCEEKQMSAKSTVRGSKKVSKNSETDKVLNIFRLALLIGVLIVSFCVPYLRGLFFESEQIVIQIILISVFILFWVYKWINKDKNFIRTPVEYAALALVLVYFLTCFTAVGRRLAVVEFLKYFMYFIVFFMISNLIKDDKEKKYVLWTIIISALGLCILGIDSAANGKIADIFNSIFKFLGLKISFFGLFVDGRIHSTMQYPNAFASYLMAVFFISIGMMLSSKNWVRFFMSGISFVLLTTFVFTLSRGAYILLILAAPLFIFLLPKGNRLKGVYNLFTVFVTTGIFSILLSKFITATSGNKSLIWPVVIVGTLLTSLIRFADDFVINVLKKVNIKAVIACVVVLLLTSVPLLIYFFTAYVPIKLEHKVGEADGFVEKGRNVRLTEGKKYKLIFNVDAKSENDKAPYAYRIFIRTKDETGLMSREEIVILNKQFGATNGIEEKEVEFTLPEDRRMVSIIFQNYYSGTSAEFYDAKLIDADSGKEVKRIILKYRFSFAELLVARFENLTADNSYNVRILFFKDGLKLFKDWWLLGAGGGAWGLLYFKYQSRLYWSTQTHSYPLQVLIETGIIGILILILLLVSIAANYIGISRKYKTEDTDNGFQNASIIVAIIFLYLHSMIDFDFSLSSIYLLVWQLMAVLNFNGHQLLSLKESYNDKMKNNKRFTVTTLKNMFYRKLNVHPFVMGIISIVVLTFPIKFFAAETYANKALESFNQGNIDKAIEYIGKAAETDTMNSKYVIGYAPIPSKPEIKLGYVDLLTQKIELESQNANKDKLGLNNYIIKANNLVKKAEKYAKYDAELLLNLGAYYLKTTEKEKGIEYINKSVELKPLVPTQWQYKANVLYLLAISYLQEGNQEKGFEFIEKTIGIINEAKEVNKYNLSPFTFNQQTQKYLESAYYIKNAGIENEAKLKKLVFQSIFNMDVNNDNIPDQWNISDKNIIDYRTDGEVLIVDSKDKSKEVYINTNSLSLEANSNYRIEVELRNSSTVKSIPFKVTEVSEKVEYLNLDGKIYSAEISVLNVSENNKLIFYVNDKYEIKSIRIFKI